MAYLNHWWLVWLIAPVLGTVIIGAVTAASSSLVRQG
ncbi:hypothetical protein DFP83_10840 [Idiomarina fontislapidosi]|jgi:hypothetical protein|nr:hypothetical protein DFP83_10840 [Idiomarina fontislapidosi]